VPRRAIDGDLIELAGGVGPVIDRARARFDAGDDAQALHLLDVVLSQSKVDPRAVELAIDVHRKLETESVNFWLTEWLQNQIGLLEAQKMES
jgi:alkyl sulfatase BDS1-like metallo-beta-lactamase superfamily hydrolase